jgi:putative sterol carrier protein
MASDSTTTFFDELAQRGYEPALAKGSGTVRFDVVDGKRTERWLLTIDHGKLSVSHGNAGADTVVRSDRRTFDRVASGRENVMAAVLRGEISIDGDTRLVVGLQRLFPRATRR